MYLIKANLSLKLSDPDKIWTFSQSFSLQLLPLSNINARTLNLTSQSYFPLQLTNPGVDHAESAIQWFIRSGWDRIYPIDKESLTTADSESPTGKKQRHQMIQIENRCTTWILKTAY